MNAASNLIDKLVDYIIDPIILLIFAAGFFLFVWGIVQFLWKLDEGAQNDGKRHMLWGIVGMLVMVSVYGIITLIDETFDLDIASPDMSRMNIITAPADFGGR
jgi:succinate dehydrogenase/fumarate reductase cytochrome b subunit